MVRSRTTLADARKAINDLRSSGSDALTCCEAVQEEILHFTTATGIACHADLTALATVAPPFHAHVLRVVTEGLLNVARHARAHQVWVRVIRQDSTSIVEIRDDGIGFDRPQEAVRTGHYGLLGLRERARLIGGRLEVESASAMGTTIRFSLPSHEGEGRPHGVEAEGQHGASLTARDIRHG
jgi:two-component system, NarL family, sensor histidine kinase YdfH